MSNKHIIETHMNYDVDDDDDDHDDGGGGAGDEVLIIIIIGNERKRSKYHSMFPFDLFVVKSYSGKSVRNLGVVFDNNFSFRSHISAICSTCFTTSGICSVFAITLI